MTDSLQAVLFDLDDTLIENDMATFGPAYLDLFSRRLAPLSPQTDMKAALRASLEAVLRHDDPHVSNHERFRRELAALAGVPIDRLQAEVDRFIAEDFPRLRPLVRRRAEAAGIVRQARAYGWKVVLATNPMFPGQAIYQRMAWAGLDAPDFARVTTPENSHACKPSPAYFREILDAINVAPEDALMVGNDWRMDMAPAIALGMAAYWIIQPDHEGPSQVRSQVASGTWQDFLAWWNAHMDTFARKAAKSTETFAGGEVD